VRGKRVSQMRREKLCIKNSFAQFEIYGLQFILHCFLNKKRWMGVVENKIIKWKTAEIFASILSI
jgi:hypothetical protein